MGLVTVSLGMQDASEEAERLRFTEAKKPIRVAGRPISEIIRDSGYTHIDFMTIDVEGSELALLEGLNLNLHCPDWLLVETDHPEAVEAACEGYMVLEEQLTFHDFLFRRTD